DYRRGADGWRDPGGLGARWPDAADPRAHPLGAAGGGAGDGVLSQQGRYARRRGTLRVGRTRGARTLEQEQLPRRRHPGGAWLGLEGARIEWRPVARGCGGAADLGLDG